MAQSVLEMAKELTMAQISAGQVTPEDMQAVLQQTYDSLMDLKVHEETGGTASSQSASIPTNWRKSITKHAITCLECGQSFKQLSIRHLRLHDTDARAYRDKYGIPRTQSLAAKETTARRRQVVQESRPWEKTPRYMKAQQGKEAAAKKTSRKKAAAKA